MDFPISKENTYKSHQSYAIIPSINVPYVDQLMEENDMKIPKNLREKEDLILYKKIESPKRETKRAKTRERKSKKTKDTEEDNFDENDEYSVSLDDLL